MQLSVLLPTHRHDLMALSRIVQACSMANASVEVIIRDNSGNADKRAQIAQFQRDHCTIVSADPCEPAENFYELLRLAKGDFIFCLADDDVFFERAIAALPDLIDRHGRDPDVIGVVGTYLIEGPRGSGFVSYKNLDSDDVTERLSGYLTESVANVIAYSPLRRTMVERVFRFVDSMPVSLSFHDQIASLLYLLSGKFMPLPNIIYGYDVGPWAEMQSAQKRDVDFYRASELDPAINKLHWFMCGFEGAVLIRNGSIFPDYSAAERQKMADQWFSIMFMRFLHNPRMTYDSRLTAEADAVCAKLRASQGQLSFADMLADICRLMALTSERKAQAYLRFWADAMRPKQRATA